MSETYAANQHWPQYEAFTNEAFLNKAIACEPELKQTQIKPVRIVEIMKTEKAYPHVEEKDEIQNR